MVESEASVHILYAIKAKLALEVAHARHEPLSEMAVHLNGQKRSNTYAPTPANTYSSRSETVHTTATTATTDCIRSGVYLNRDPSRWKPRLDLTKVIEPSDTQDIYLNIRECKFKPYDPILLLESDLEVQCALPRSFFVTLAQKEWPHHFVFDYPDHPWFMDLFGLRKMALINIREENSDELWELHLKPSKDMSNLFGYLCKHSDMIRTIKEQQLSMLRCQKLPLVLDLDDTLVRLIGNEARYVSEEAAKLAPERIRTLKDGRRVLTTERITEFLQWAERYFEISICSLGDQSYVEGVIASLDPERLYVRGIYYSARQEWEYISRSNNPRRPSKDLLALYAYCAIKEPGLGTSFTLPLIVDDLVHMWPSEQHDNIIVVKERKDAPVWSVNLFPTVQRILQQIHTEFFRQLQAWQNAGGIFGSKDVVVGGREPPSTVAIYKDILRNSLRDRIATEGV